MILIARKSYPKFNKRLPRSRMNNAYLVERGEPYFIGGFHDKQPCVKALGPGSYWERSGSSFLIIGEGMNGEMDLEGDIDRVFDARRRGDIWGKWYSKHCVAGELGFLNFRLVSSLTKVEFNEYRSKIYADSERDQWSKV